MPGWRDDKPFPDRAVHQSLAEYNLYEGLWSIWLQGNFQIFMPNSPPYYDLILLVIQSEDFIKKANYYFSCPMIQYEPVFSVWMV